ncbi:MAG: hypothetical protein NWE98_02730 [Candidatus Bathyarchaeota archaeon]|nr:hypothetical protein [Candidatus Bathyarchaeota archaeon]
MPAIIELKKPLDAGPRRIKDTFGQRLLSELMVPLSSMEEASKLDGQLVVSVLSSFDFIFNLECPIT